MRQAFSRIVLASGLLTLACATALDEGPQAGATGDESGGSSGAGGSLAVSGSTSTSAGSGTAGSSSAGTSSSPGGKGGSGTLAFGGTSTSGGAGTAGGPGGGGSASAGAAAGGVAGSMASAGKSGATGAGGSAGSGSAGSGSAGATTAACDGVADWTSKTYALGDRVASTCSGVFAGSCPEGQAHQFECNPMAGAAGLPWCQSREPGVGNGWSEAWIDKGQCQ